ncbi:hypothetical protein [Rhizobium skierniewicense]|uniref:hypothetical protein n=1 Tax=Rhizobium skierniewicense TaxID=984260 RepID=UPI001571EE9B|nr:hypothetical protein [Rhizobium skierniewicense]NTF32307.1 hypothetical protein [Rhizobium skierniewicense]
MSKIYVAAPGRVIPGGWPDGGRSIPPFSQMHRRMIAAGDLIEKEQVEATPPASTKPVKKD